MQRLSSSLVLRSAFWFISKFKVTFPALACLVLLLAPSAWFSGSSAHSAGKQAVSTQQGSTPKCTKCSPPGNQIIYVPLIDLPESQGGEVVFNSRSPHAVDVTPTFYKADGTTVVG